MATSLSTSWLEACRNALMDSPEWVAMLHTIYQQLLQVLAEDRIGHFSDLSPDEQAAYMSKLEERLSSSPSYPNFIRKLSTMVDQAVTGAADSIGKELFPNRTRLERILEISAAGAAKLIADTPDATPETIMQQLQILKNIPITPTLRKFAWKLCFSMPSIRASFEEYQLNKSGILQEDEINIADKCKSILLATYPDLMSNTALVRTMRIVLSFLDKEIVPLQPVHYYLMIPPSICYLQDSQDGANANAAGLVLEHMAALEKASYCSRIEDPQFFQSIMQEFNEKLKAKDPELHQLLFSILDQQPQSNSTSISVVRKATSFPLASGSLDGVLEEIFRYCFIRICSISTMMFIWDQLILSRWDALPQYAVGFLICLRQHLLQVRCRFRLQVVVSLGPHLLQTSLQQAVASAFGIQRPKAIFDDRNIRLDAPGSSSNLDPDYKLPAFSKSKVDVPELNRTRVVGNMNLWRARSRQIAWWATFLTARSTKQSPTVEETHETNGVA